MKYILLLFVAMAMFVSCKDNAKTDHGHDHENSEEAHGHDHDGHSHDAVNANISDALILDGEKHFKNVSFKTMQGDRCSCPNKL